LALTVGSEHAAGVVLQLGRGELAGGGLLSSAL
jgi:hypothetical protein